MAEFITKISNGQISVDDTILVKDYPCTAGSKMLENFKPLFSAEAVTRLEKAGYEIAGKANVGEFGLDLLGETSYFGETTENGKLVGAGAKLVKDGVVKANLSVDLNGYPRRSAKEAGVKFIKPTYGTVSRYGVIACACSGEQIGVTANSTKDLIDILTVISGHDQKDGTSLKEEKYQYKAEKKSYKVAVIKDLSEGDGNVDKVVKKLIEKGVSVTEIFLGITEQIQTAWQILSSAETCNNLSRYDGVKYGYRTDKYDNIDDLYVNTRTEAFGFLTKANIIYGSDVLSKGKYEKCYDKSLKIRRLAVEKMAEIFSTYDAVLLSVSSNKQYDVTVKNDFNAVYSESKYTALASITGLPAIVTDGAQIIGDYFNENLLFGLCEILEERE